MRQLILALLLFTSIAGLVLGLFPLALVGGVVVSADDATLVAAFLAALGVCEAAWGFVVAKRHRAHAVQLREASVTIQELEREILAVREALDVSRSRHTRLEEQVVELDKRLSAVSESKGREVEELRVALVSAEAKAKEAVVRVTPTGSEVMHFLSRLQEKGRFLDFIMEEVTGVSDQQIGAAARFVHDGCRSVVREYLELAPVQDGEEGKPVTITAGRSSAEVRFIGRSAQSFPVTGRLVHRGWRVTKASFPEIAPVVDRAQVLAPAEVEIN
jgi:hypothetical protein